MEHDLWPTIIFRDLSRTLKPKSLYFGKDLRLHLNMHVRAEDMARNLMAGRYYYFFVLLNLTLVSNLSYRTMWSEQQTQINRLNAVLFMTAAYTAYWIIVIFSTFATYLTIWLANLPLSIRVQTTLLASMCHAMPLKIIFFDFDTVVKNKSKCGRFSVCPLWWRVNQAFYHTQKPRRSGTKLVLIAQLDYHFTISPPYSYF